MRAQAINAGHKTYGDARGFAPVSLVELAKYPCPHDAARAVATRARRDPEAYLDAAFVARSLGRLDPATPWQSRDLRLEFVKYGDERQFKNVAGERDS